jgi:hypothetical protein
MRVLLVSTMLLSAAWLTGADLKEVAYVPANKVDAALANEADELAVLSAACLYVTSGEATFVAGGKLEEVPAAVSYYMVKVPNK